LRKRAEARVRVEHGPVEELSLSQVSELLHDYQVHQIELELQNEELRHVQQELEAARDKFHGLYNTVPAGCLTVDAHGTITQVNQTFAEMIDQDASRLRGRNMSELMHPEDVSTFFGRFKAFFKNPDKKTLQFRLANEADAVTVRCRGRLDAGGVSGSAGSARQPLLLLVLHDITEQLLMEEALQESEVRHRTLFEEALNPILVTDENGRYIDANKAALEFLECSRDELVGREVWTFTPPESLEKTRRDHSPFVQRRTVETEYLVHGSVKTLLLNVVPMEIKGRVILYGIGQDVTQSRQAVLALGESEERFAKAFRSSPAPLVISDITTGRFIDVNDCWVDMLGYSRDEQIGRTSKEVGIWADPSERDRIVRQIVEKGGFKNEPIEFRTRSGQLITALWSAEAIVLGGQSVMLSMIADITERVRAERERDKLQAMLLQAQKMESVGILAGGVAHDFNNLLQAISGNVQLLLRQKSEIDPDVPRLKAVEQSIDRAARLVSQLLLFGRKAEMRRKTVDLNQELKNTVAILERTIPRMISIKLHLDDHLRPISGDPVQIEQVVLNLGTNAADAMPEGGDFVLETSNVRLDGEFARTHPGSSPGRYVLLSVSDTGCGMSRETLAHLFDPFYTTKEVGKGTGLGLASVYGIVKSHDGYVLCYSEVGQGTTFKIYLPVMEDTADTGPEETRVDEHDASEVQGRGETILVVDDEPELLELTQDALESFGYKVVCAASGEQALDIFGRDGQGIGLVLLDLNMPGMGGRKCMQELLSRKPEAKVLIASGYTPNGLAGSSLSAGAAGFLGKPYQLGELAAKVRSILDDAGAC